MNKKIISLPLLIMMLIGLAGIGYGACVFTSPGASEIIKGSTYQLNVSGITRQTLKNCSVTATSALTGSTLPAIWAYNVSGEEDTYAVATIDTNNLTDASDWVFAATCYNLTLEDSETCTSRTGVTIDNSIPVVASPTPSDTNKVTSGNDVAFSVTCTNATAAILFVEDTAYTMTESSDTCSYTIDKVSNGVSSWYVVATDGLNSTTSSTYTVEVREGGAFLQNLGEGGTVTGGEEEDNSMALLVVMAAGYFLFINKDGPTSKKRRKR